MKEFVNLVQCAFAAVGGFFGWFVGGLDGVMYALIVFVAVDYATGLMAAGLEKKLSSSVGFRGIFKKVVIFCLVAVGHMVDAHVIGNGSVLRTAVIFFYLSVLEIFTQTIVALPAEFSSLKNPYQYPSLPSINSP